MHSALQRDCLLILTQQHIFCFPMGSSATTTASTMDQTDPASDEDGNVSSFHLPQGTDSSQDTPRRNRNRSKREANDKGVQGMAEDGLLESEKEEGGEEGTQERDTLHMQKNRSSAVSRALGREYRKILNLGKGDDMQSDLRKETKPRFNMTRDGIICRFCGATTSYDTQPLTTYPSSYMCGDCAITQERQAPAPIQQDTVTHSGANLIQIYEEQLKDLERDVRLNFFGSTHEEEAGFEQLAGLMKRSRIPNGTHEQHSQQSQARGQPLVAGGMSWTVEESNLFFQGLRRFGKHNVWAIQEFIKTRSLAEVVTMIETMEMELSRRKSLGLKTIRLSEMPMATEVDDQVVAIEEECASRLIDQEMKTFWKQHARSPSEATPEIVDKTRLFNMRTLSDLSSRLYIQNEGASMEREVVQSLYDTLKEWLTPVVKELVALQHERHRVTALLKKYHRDGCFPHASRKAAPVRCRCIF
ncbi:MAG: hypothetical protein J3R72DRAFT_38982 [Linnemannia gamsii]|nr:MAG: hypothetical protein J3R72DRAFT_38982 [Linnemannia gamsii]